MITGLLMTVALFGALATIRFSMMAAITSVARSDNKLIKQALSELFAEFAFKLFGSVALTIGAAFGAGYWL